jgi:hypothetical protein
MNSILNRALASFQQVFEQIEGFLPNLIAMFVILILGFAIALILRWLVARGLKRSRFDDLARRLGLEAGLSKANIHRAPAMLATDLAYGLLLLITLLLALTALNIETATNVVTTIFAAVPKLIIAVIVFFVGYLLSQFFARSVLIAAVNAQWRAARLVSHFIQALILLFTLSVSLEQIGLGRSTIVAAFSIVFGGVVLGLALAFGLGGRDLAREFLESRLKRNSRGKDPVQPFSHL